MDAEQPRILIAEVLARPESTSAVADLLTGYGRLVRAEPGNRAFLCYQVEGQPERFLVYEIYADEAAFQAHLSHPANAEVNAKLAPLVQDNGSALTFLTQVE